MLFVILFNPNLILTTISYPLDFLYNERSIFIHATVTSVLMFAERVPVTIHAVGSIGSGFENASVLFKRIYSICLCFSQAHMLENGQLADTSQPPVGTDLSEEQYAGVYLDLTTKKPTEKMTGEFGPGAYLVGHNQTVEWFGPTDSVPSIIVTYMNLTTAHGRLEQEYAIRSYPSKSLHIESFSSYLSTQIEIEFFVTSVIISVFGIAQYLLGAVSKREERKPRIVN
jgi:hypothetical protein